MTGARLDLQARASVAVNFELGQLVSDEDDVADVLAFLDEDCERIQTPRGDRWSVVDRCRTRTLQRVPLPRLRKLRDRIEADSTPLQQALDRSLRSGWRGADLDLLSAADARALGVVAGWWAGTRPQVPAPAEVGALVSRLTLFADIRAMAGDHFVGRWAELAELQTHFHDPDARPHILYGVGGVGKSAVLANHVVWAIDKAGALAAVLDFDDPTLNPNYGVADLVSRLIDAVVRQLGEPAARLRKSALDMAAAARQRTASSSKASRADTHEWDKLILGMLSVTDQPILVVLDTFEQVQRRGPSALSATLSLVDSLLGHRDRIRVVIAGRADVGGLTASRTNLTGLEPKEAIRLLAALCTEPVPPEVATQVVEHFGTSPLTMRLTAQLLSAGGAQGDLFALDLRDEQIDAVLYRRVLARISDPDIAKLAHPGLILRRITPDIIQHVLAKPCKVDAADEWQARYLFDRFAREVMLVELDRDGAALVHRADVREIMLPPLLRDRPVAARNIQRAAIRYYAASAEPEAKVEELYHRLMLAQSPATLSRHWHDRAAQALMTAMDELPPASRAYLAARLPDTFLRDEDRRLLSDTQWVAQIRPQVLRLISTGELDQALALLRERRGHGGRVLLPGLEIEVLEARGSYDDAIAMARANRQTAAATAIATDVVTFSLHLARLLERTSEAKQAAAVLDEALKVVRARTTDRLRVLTAWLALRRRSGEPPPKSRKHEAIALYRHCGAAKVRKVPGLLRDLAAEVGTEEPEILTEALRTVGLDAASTGSVPSALAELDRSAATEPGVVADLARVEQAGDSVIWDGIAAMPRSESGHAVAEVIATFPDSADGVHEAVAADYQYESDAALFDNW